jgi:hypothetical protein
MRIERHTDLHVYRKAFDVAMKVFEVSRRFPKDETYSLTDPGSPIVPLSEMRIPRPRIGGSIVFGI